MVYWLYSFALSLGAIVGAPFWIFRGMRDGKYFGSFARRLGWRLPEQPRPARPMWIHAVSVGEVLAAKPLIAALRAERPDVGAVVSTVTLAGHALAQTEFAGAAAAFYFPFDWDWSVNRYLDRIAPRAVILMETELWPNFLKACARRQVPVVLANARLSERSRRRFRRIPGLIRTMLSQIAAIAAQTHEDRRRFVDLGADPEHVHVTGNVKFDFAPSDAAQHRAVVESIRARIAAGATDPIIVVGSSMKGEERLFIDALRTLRAQLPSARMILAPRHPERFDEVARLLSESTVPFVRRSTGNGDAAGGAQVLLLDSIGELRAVYALASVAVIGGSFLPPHGGHNLLEPAALGKAIVFGPQMSNFGEMARMFLREQAARQCSPEQLPRALAELLENSRARDLLGHRALTTFRQNQGATRATVDLVSPHLG
jgi:3-deoxy-D-manno-octulosonic-acid transferase